MLCTRPLPCRFIFQTFFDCLGYARLVVLEDDMQLAPDFFPYFQATAPLLDADDSLFCISSWNDHGQVRKGGWGEPGSQALSSLAWPGVVSPGLVLV
jgi:hypothetical protein